MAQEGLRRHVLRVLRMWRTWSIFSDDFLNGLQVGLVTSPTHPALSILLRLHIVDLKHLCNVKMRFFVMGTGITEIMLPP